MDFIEKLKFDEKGLIPVIIQDWQDNTVLMLAYMNKEAVEKTLAAKDTYFWSRSRKNLWHKGEKSGNFQKVKEIYFDCDQDTLLIKVEQIGNAACHEGYRSCFHYKLEKGKIVLSGEKVFNPSQKYKK